VPQGSFLGRRISPQVLSLLGASNSHSNSVDMEPMGPGGWYLNSRLALQIATGNYGACLLDGSIPIWVSTGRLGRSAIGDRSS
jgi:hypothetical protein